MPQLARWLTFIEQYDYEIVHRSGTQHGKTDRLSRRPIPESDRDADRAPARVAVIHDCMEAAHFLSERLPSVEEISIGDAEVYSEHMRLQTEPSALLEVKVITQTGGCLRLGRGESR